MELTLNKVAMHTETMRVVEAIQEQPEAAKEETEPVVAVQPSVRMVKTAVQVEQMEKGGIGVQVTKESKLEEMEEKEETELLAIRQEI